MPNTYEKVKTVMECIRNAESLMYRYYPIGDAKRRIKELTDVKDQLKLASDTIEELIADAVGPIDLGEEVDAT